MTIAQTLAQRIIATNYDQLTPKSIAYAKIGLLDTIAVGIAGATEEPSLIARKLDGTETGSALVWGTSRRTKVRDAAFLNGIAANVLDYDDCADNLGGHPSSPILPALIALAEDRRASGRELLTAYVVGFETETNLGRGLNFHHYEKGWHPTATLGVFGAAAACARLLNLDEERATHALALCASLAGGVKSNLGSMAKPLHVGQTSRNGLLAAQLAAEGFTANADALEHHHGFFEVFNGPGTYDTGLILEKWGSPWDIEMPGIAIKQYPCCLSTQSAIDLMLDLVERHDVRPEDVGLIDVAVAARRLDHTNRPQPRSALDSKLSVQYVIARAVTDRQVSLPHFEGEAYRDPNVRRVAALVRTRPLEPDALAHLGDFGAAITLELKDGRSCEGTIDRPIGHAPGVPIPADLLRSKFEACVSRKLTHKQTTQLYAAVQEVENAREVRELTSIFETAQSSALGAAG